MTLNRKASLLFLIALGLYLLLSMVLPTEGLPYGTLLALSAFAVSIPAFLVPAVFFRRKNKYPLYPCPRLPHIMIAVVLGVGCILLNIALVCLQEALTYGVEINSTAVDVNAGLADASIPMMILTVAIIPAVSEEFLMRGALLETWKRTSFVCAALLTALLFALLHASPSNIVVYFAMGMLFAYVYHITGNVWLTVIVHFVNNLISVISAAAIKGEGGEEAVEVMTRGEYVSGFVSYLLLAALLIIPMMILLKNSCRKLGIGMFAAPAEEPMLPGAEPAPYAMEPQPAFYAGEERYDVLGRPVSELIHDRYEAAPVPAEPAQARGGAKVLLADPLLWVAIAFLVLLNVAAGLIEFGVIDAGL